MYNVRCNVIYYNEIIDVGMRQRKIERKAQYNDRVIIIARIAENFAKYFSTPGLMK